MIRRTAALAAGLLAGCWDANPVRGPDHYSEPRIIPAHQWSGGTVHVTASWFGGRFRVVIFGGGDTLRSARLDDTTFAVTLPIAGSGLLALSATNGRSGISLGSVRTYGFRRRIPVGYSFSALTIHDGSALYALGRASNYDGDPGPTALALTNLATGAWSSLPAFGKEDHYGPGPSFRPNEVVISQGDSSVVCSLLPSPHGCVPSRVSGPAPHAVWLSDSVWLSRDAVSITVTRFDGPAVTIRQFPLFFPFRVVLGPRAKRVAFAHRTGPNVSNTLVLDSEIGDTVFSVPGLVKVGGVAFSPDEAMLLFAGSADPNSAQDSLILVESAGGARLHAMGLPEGFSAGAVAMDPVLPVAYVTGDSLGYLQVRVFDFAALKEVGVLEVDDETRGFFASPGTVAVDRNRGTLHVLSPYQNDYQFDLIPPE